MTLRAAKMTDAPAMAKIMGDWFETTSYVPRLHSRIEDETFIEGVIGSQGALVHVDETVNGFIATDGIQIGQLYVAEDARGLGVGTKLLHAIKGRATELSLWCFQSNKGARRFYERNGFIIATMTNGAANEERLPDILYHWRQPR